MGKGTGIGSSVPSKLTLYIPPEGVCMHMYAYVYMHIHTQMHVYMHTHMDTYIYSNHLRERPRVSVGLTGTRMLVLNSPSGQQSLL